MQCYSETAPVGQGPGADKHREGREIGGVEGGGAESAGGPGKRDLGLEISSFAAPGPSVGADSVEIHIGGQFHAARQGQFLGRRGRGGLPGADGMASFSVTGRLRSPGFGSWQAVPEQSWVQEEI